MPFKDHDLNQTLKNLHQMEKEVENLLKDFFVSKNPLLMVAENGWTPHVDIYETAEAFIIKAELAGVRKEDIKIQMNDRVVILTGKRDDECNEVREHYHLAEISYGIFIRQIELPENLNSELVRAKFDRGFLIIYIPKAQSATGVSISIPISD